MKKSTFILNAEQHIFDVFRRLYAGDAPPAVLKSLILQGMSEDTAFLIFTAGKILYEN